MANIFGGSGALGGLESILGGSQGGIAALLPSLLGMLGGDGANGLAELVKAFGAKGLGDIIESWVGSGPNKKITPGQVKKGLGTKKMKKFAADSGLSVDEAAKHVADILPNLVNTLTPNGQVPDVAALKKGLAGIQGMLGK